VQRGDETGRLSGITGRVGERERVMSAIKREGKKKRLRRDPGHGAS